MLLKSVKLNIESGYQIAMLNEKDAKKIGVYSGERIELKVNEKTLVAIADITNKDRLLKEGEIGLFNEVYEPLGIKKETNIEVNLAYLPKSIEYIREKLNGKELTKEKIQTIVNDIVKHNLTSIEITYFISACYINDLNAKETAYLTVAMAESGDTIKFKKGEKILDVHCVGGVAGNRTTMLIVPIIACAGFKIPKASSRAITSPAGTADTFGMLTNVSINGEKIKQVVDITNGCLIWGGGINLAPADDFMIKLRHTMSIDPKGVMLASILAKKYAVGSNIVLLDIPTGKGSKFSKKEAKKISKRFYELAKLLKIKLKIILTDGTEPIGHGIGVALENKDVIKALKNEKDAPQDLIKKSLEMSKIMLEMSGVKNAKKVVEDIFYSKSAYEKYKEIIKHQGQIIDDIENIRDAKFSYDVRAQRSGVVSIIDNKFISTLARVLGAPQDQYAGIWLRCHKKDIVNEEQILFTMYSDSESRINNAKKELYKMKEFFVY